MCNVDWVVLKHIYFTRTIEFIVEIVVVAFSCFFVYSSDAKIIVYFKSFALALKSAKVNVPLSVG